QVRTRLLKVVSSASATLAILVSAMFAGQISGRVADLVGSAVVVQMMIWTAYQMIASALPDLMDRMLDPSQLTLVNRVLLCNFDRIDAIHHVRTRRSGVIKYIEIGVGFSADRRIGEIDAINQSLKKELEAQIPDAKVTLVASAAPLWRWPCALRAAERRTRMVSGPWPALKFPAPSRNDNRNSITAKELVALFPSQRWRLPPPPVTVPV